MVFDHVKRNRLRYIGIATFTTGTYAAIYYSNLEYTPITNRRRFMIFSRQHLKEIEELEKNQVIKSKLDSVELTSQCPSKVIIFYRFKLFEKYKKQILDAKSPYLHKALRVANRLFLANKDLHDVSDINWTLTVIEDDLVNAVALPVMCFYYLKDYLLDSLIKYFI